MVAATKAVRAARMSFIFFFGTGVDAVVGVRLGLG
jgi:hypothetical protein